MTEDKMVGWHHLLDVHEFEKAPGSLACCSPWGHKEWDMTEQLNLTDGALNRYVIYINFLCLLWDFQLI